MIKTPTTILLFILFPPILEYQGNINNTKLKSDVKYNNSMCPNFLITIDKPHNLLKNRYNLNNNHWSLNNEGKNSCLNAS